MSIILNDLYDYGLKIYQDDKKFKFSLDSLLLAEFVEIKKSDKKLLDLCSGNAPIPLILASQNDIAITGIELQPEIYDLAQKSISYNHLEPKITMLNINAKNTPTYFPGNNFDIITCNPPFFKVHENSLINITKELAIARHELSITLAELIKTTSYLLKDCGKFYLVHRPELLEEILTLCSIHHLHLKEAIFIHSKTDKCAIIVLMKFVKNSQPGAKIRSLVINRHTTSYQNIFKERNLKS